MTPRFVFTERLRMLGRDGANFNQDRQGLGEGVAFGVAPFQGELDRYTTASCWETRLSGVAPCCRHPVSYEDIDPDEDSTISAPRYVTNPVAATCDVQEDCPTNAFCCARDTDPRWENSTFALRAGQACGCDEDGCRMDHQCGYGLELGGVFRPGLPHRVFPAEHFDRCIAPLAPGDAPIGNMLLLELRSNIDDVDPIPLATTYPDSSLDAGFWSSSPTPQATVAGYGWTAHCGTAGDSGDRHARHVAEDATSLVSRPFTVRTTGADVMTQGVYFEGDRNAPGTAKVDWGAPLLWDFGAGDMRVLGLRDGFNANRCDQYFSSHLSPDVLPGMLRFLDPDGDGIQRGHIDAPAPGYIDRDGDGLSEARMVGGEAVPTGNDNCIPPEDATLAELAEYADSSASDRDGDGVGDVCDVCPDDWDPDQAGCVSRVALSAEESPTGVALEVGDTVGVACIRRNNVSGAQRDRDDDGVYDNWCDNCVGGGAISQERAFNPEQEDTDGDGVGDRCDVCPDLADAALSDPLLGDLDRDGIGDACGDNCPHTANTLQENCNADAEIAQSLFVPGDASLPGVGDACDPTPYGETRVELFNGVRSADSRTVNQVRLVVDATASRTVGDVRTGFRFCPCALANEDDIQTRVFCAQNGSPGNGQCAIDDRLSYDVLVDDSLDEPPTWRSTTTSTHLVPDEDAPIPSLVDPDIGGVHEGLRLEARIRYERATPGFQEALQVRWRHPADRFRWNDVFGDDAGGRLHGVLWTHSPGRRAGQFFDESQRSLAHHYWSGFIRQELEVPAPSPCLRYAGVWSGPGGCPLCTGSFPAPFFGSPATAGPSAPFEAGCGGSLAPPVLEVPGPPIEVADFIGDPRDVLSREDIRWLTAVEPLEWLPEQGPRALAVDGQLSPVALLQSGPNGLFFASADEPCTPNSCDPAPVPAAATSASAIPAAAFPAPALRVSGEPADPSECVTVLSARDAAIYALAGDARTLDGSVHVQSAVLSTALDDAQVYPAELGRVLAATVRPQDGVLYVLDEVEREPGGGQRGARVGWPHSSWPRWSRQRFDIRLLRVAIGTTGVAGGQTTLATWPRTQRFTRHQLVPAPEGGLWLLASRERGPHVVVYLQGRGARLRRWRPLGFGLRPDPIADITPRADARGLSYVVQNRDRQRAMGVTRDDLWSLRPRDLARCF